MLTVSMQSRKTQIASDTIYITLHNPVITICQGSCRPNLFHLFASKTHKMENILDKQLSTRFVKNTRSRFYIFSQSYVSDISSLNEVLSTYEINKQISIDPCHFRMRQFQNRGENSTVGLKSTSSCLTWRKVIYP